MVFHRTKSILSIPTELIREIALSVDASKDKSALCRTSRLFNVIATPVLYRHIHLDSVEKTLGCFYTLSKSPKRHDCVRSITIEIYKETGDYISSDMVFPLENVLRNLRQLELLCLRIPDFDDKFLIVFATLYFPSLLAFSSPHTGSLSPIFSSFINRHTQLTHLDLLRPLSTLVGSDAKPPLLHLPGLRCFRGCAIYAACLVVQYRTLWCVDIYDAPLCTDIETLFAVLANATRPSTPFTLTFLWDGPKTALFTPLVKYLPNTRNLSVGPFKYAMYDPLSRDTVEQIAESFESLGELTRFDFENVPAMIGWLDLCEPPIEPDRAALALWGSRCPSLVSSKLPQLAALGGYMDL
ncbi:hypothetical protein B0H11DRAFT_339685 [Mycena galericulata]|nr:hypothetical protein B0H11DRAFT_339685 [Mycena galericulata]